MGGKGIVADADETYVGGKAKNRAYRKPAEKKAVVPLVEREGHVRSFHVAILAHVAQTCRQSWDRSLIR